MNKEDKLTTQQQRVIPFAVEAVAAWAVVAFLVMYPTPSRLAFALALVVVRCLWVNYALRKWPID